MKTLKVLSIIGIIYFLNGMRITLKAINHHEASVVLVAILVNVVLLFALVLSFATLLKAYKVNIIPNKTIMDMSNIGIVIFSLLSLIFFILAIAKVAGQIPDLGLAYMLYAIIFSYIVLDYFKSFQTPQKSPVANFTDMKTWMVMSIIGVVFFITGLPDYLKLVNHYDADVKLVAIVGAFSFLYASILSVVILLKSFKINLTSKMIMNVMSEQTLKKMSIIGIVLFTLCVLFFIIIGTDPGAAHKVLIEDLSLFGALYLIYALTFSIVILVHIKYFQKRKRPLNNSVTDELIKLNELKDKGVLTEEEFNTQKDQLLKL